MKLTIRGTIKALRRIREDLSKLVGNGFKVKLGEESLKGPEFIDLLPEKQRLVLDKAIEMDLPTMHLHHCKTITELDH